VIRERPRSAFGAHLDQHRRLLIAAVVGTAAATAASFFCPWQLSALAGWDVAAAFVVGSVWSFIVVLDAEGTRHIATREDDSRTAADLIMVIASVVSLVGVVVGLAHARDHHGALSSVLTMRTCTTTSLSVASSSPQLTNVPITSTSCTSRSPSA
jgi:uncharacterized membrane protein